MWIQMRRFGIGGLCLLIGLLCLLPLYALAEVDIDTTFPDENFRAYLRSLPAGADGILTDEEIATIETIMVGSKSIASLEGLEVFTFLEELYCYSNLLTELPELPDTLTALYCYINPLTALPTLPDGLRTLYCDNTELTALPTLPDTLRVLGCDNNQLTALPTLPDTLTLLHCGNNQLTALPTLPSGLGHLHCESNQLTELDLSPIIRLRGFFGFDQTPTLFLTPNDTGSYSLEIALNEPDFTPTTGLSYANGVLTSNSKEVRESPFQVQTGLSGKILDGDFTLKYVETISASAGEHGSITPSGKVAVVDGEDQTFVITPNTGYRVKDVLVNGESKGRLGSYTFEEVNASGSIQAQFELMPYTVTASRTLGGSITPLGKTTVLYGGSQAYTIAPDAGYRIQDVKVNGKSIGVVTSYTFENVKADAMIEVSFEKVDYTITASAGKGGSIAPTGAVGVLHGESQTFTLTAEDGYRVKDVKVNGRSLGVINSYTFESVQADATIEAQFEERPIDPVPPTGDRFPLEMLFVSLVGMVLVAVMLLRKAKKA